MPGLSSPGAPPVVADPHGRVWGEAGIRYILDSSGAMPLTVYVMLPSCVPATDLETAGANLRGEDLASLSSRRIGCWAWRR